MRYTRPTLSVEDWKRLNQLLERALELEGEARSVWLETLPPELAHLREIARRLISDPTGLYDYSGLSEVQWVAADALQVMRRDRPGDRIGPWLLERHLAEGGMGAVWLAERADGLMSRTAALKLPRTEWVDRGLSERIARERVILARLQHPNIAVLYDAGITAEGRPYLALEYVEGDPIDAFCNVSVHDLPELLQLFVPVVRAVAYAHSRLVIHRDLKPSNILVRADRTAKLLDFGVSQLIEGDAADATALTRVMGRPLTLAYAAPEQVLGQPVTVTADVYALGVMLFELSTGSRLYRSTTAHALEHEIVRGETRRPSAAAAERARAKELRGDLDAIILTALKRAPEERYESAAALADDLEKYIAGEPVRAQPDSRAYRLRKFVKRNRRPVAAGAAVVLAVGTGLAVALWQATVARDQASEAMALNTFVLSLIKQADPAASQQTRAADAAMLAAIEQRIDSEFKGSPHQLLRLRLTVGDAYRNRGESTAAKRVFQRAVDEAGLALPKDDLQLLSAQVRASDHRWIVSNTASQSLEAAVEILRTKGAAGADLLVDALLISNELQNVYGVPALTPLEKGFDKLNEAYDVATRHFGEGSRQQLRVAVPLMERKTLFGDAAEAQRMLESSLVHAHTRTDTVLSSAEYQSASSVYAARLCSTERSVEGLSILWNSLAALRTAHGENSVQVEEVLLALSSCFNAVGDQAAPATSFEVFEIAAARERPPSTNLMRRAQAAFFRATSLHDFEAAERYYQSAIENSQAIADPPLREKLMRRVAMMRVCLLAKRGDTDEAETFAATVMEALDAEYRQSQRLTPLQYVFWTCLSFAQRQSGRPSEALRTAQKFIERCNAMKYPNPQLCLPGAIAEALAELDEERPSDALATLEKYLKHPHDFSSNRELGLAYGRILLAHGRVPEALEVLRLTYGGWLASNHPRGVFAAEAAYWFGRAWMADGDVKRGRWMVDEARRTLATSRLKLHQALAAQGESDARQAPMRTGELAR